MQPRAQKRNGRGTRRINSPRWTQTPTAAKRHGVGYDPAPIHTVPAIPVEIDRGRSGHATRWMGCLGGGGRSDPRPQNGASETPANAMLSLEQPAFNPVVVPRKSMWSHRTCRARAHAVGSHCLPPVWERVTDGATVRPCGTALSASSAPALGLWWVRETAVSTSNMGTRRRRRLARLLFVIR